MHLIKHSIVFRTIHNYVSKYFQDKASQDFMSIDFDYFWSPQHLPSIDPVFFCVSCSTHSSSFMYLPTPCTFPSTAHLPPTYINCLLLFLIVSHLICWALRHFREINKHCNLSNENNLRTSMF